MSDKTEKNRNNNWGAKVTIPSCPEVEPTVQKAVEQFQQTFGERLVAVYLLGSLSRGGFSPSCSDVDLAFILTGDLAQDDQDKIDSFTGLLCQTKLPLCDKLSLFWESTSNLHNKFPSVHARLPEFDRIDLFQSGLLIWGEEVRKAHYKRPTQAVLEMNGAALILEKLNNPKAIAMIANPHLLFTQSVIPPSKIILFPIRLMYTALTGQVGGNSEAVQYYCQYYTDSTVELVKEAFSWRQKAVNKDSLDLRFIKENLLLIYQRFSEIYK